MSLTSIEFYRSKSSMRHGLVALTLAGVLCGRTTPAPRSFGRKTCCAA